MPRCSECDGDRDQFVVAEKAGGGLNRSVRFVQRELMADEIVDPRVGLELVRRPAVCVTRGSERPEDGDLLADDHIGEELAERPVSLGRGKDESATRSHQVETGVDGLGVVGRDIDDDVGSSPQAVGDREPEIYGTDTLDDYVAFTTGIAAEHGLAVEAHQSNVEGELIGHIHSARGRCAAIVINPGAFTHYAWAIHDALAAFDGPVVEVHISNPNAREPWRHTSVIAPVSTGSIMGFGKHGYDLAIRAVAAKLSG